MTQLQRSLRERAEAVDTVVHAALWPPTRQGYRKWLCDLYRFISAFEKNLMLAPGLNSRFVHPRLKAGRLSADLMVLGLSAHERMRLADRCNVPELADPIEALGWLFVVDRLTLGFDAIRARLLPELSFEIDAAGSFLDGYADELLDRWVELDRVLAGLILDDRDMEALQLAGHAALDCLEASIISFDARQTDPAVPVVEIGTRGI